MATPEENYDRLLTDLSGLSVDLTVAAHEVRQVLNAVKENVQSGDFDGAVNGITEIVFNDAEINIMARQTLLRAVALIQIDNEDKS